jgi:N-acetylglutamate synthase
VHSLKVMAVWTAAAEPALPPSFDAIFDGDTCDAELIRGLEERLVNVWPAVTTLLMKGWVIRMANGYSGRANSVSAIVSGAELKPELLGLIESLFIQAGLEPCVRVTPVAQRGTLEMLLTRGYRVKDQSLVMLAPIGTQHSSAVAVRLEPKPSSAWLTGVSALQEPSKSNAAHLEAITGRIQLPAAFATIMENGASVGFGMAAVDRGVAEIGSIILAPSVRGRGLGRGLMQALLGWATNAGAGQAFLQVTEDNTPARRLYKSLGFETVCGYTTMIRDGA